MNTQFNHLIAKHGVLASFSIARKVSKSDIKKFGDKIKKHCKNKGDFNDLLQKEILKTTKYSMNHDLIPGLILPKSQQKTDTNETKNTKLTFKDDQELMKLNYVSSIIAKKFIDNKFSKDEICYLILSLLSALGLNDQDFKTFHKKYGNPDDTNDESSDEDEDEDEDESSDDE